MNRTAKVCLVFFLVYAIEPTVAANDATRFFELHPNHIDIEEWDDRILFANKQLGMEFVKGKRGFEINRLYSIDHDHDYLATKKASGSRELFEIRMTPDIRGSGRDHRGDSTKPSLMGIMDEMAADAFSVDAHSATTVSWKKSKSNGNTTLHLYWNDIPVRDDQHILDAEVTVTLRPAIR